MEHRSLHVFANVEIVMLIDRREFENFIGHGTVVIGQRLDQSGIGCTV